MIPAFWRAKWSKSSLIVLLLISVLTLLSSLAVWWWGSRFEADAHAIVGSEIKSHYFVKGMRATVYDAADAKASPKEKSVRGASENKQLRIEAEHAEALDEAGRTWRLSQVKLKGSAIVAEPLAAGVELPSSSYQQRYVEVVAPTCLWDAIKQRIFFEQAVDVKLFENQQLSAHLQTQALTWSLHDKILFTEAPVVLQYGSQYVFRAQGAYWNMLSGQLQLKSQVHGRVQSGAE